MPAQQTQKTAEKPKFDRTMRVLSVYHEAHVCMDFTAPQPDFEVRSRTMQRVLDSYTWVDAPDISIAAASLSVPVSSKWRLNPKAEEWYVGELPFKGGQTYENPGIATKLTVRINPVAADKTADVAIESARKQQAEQRQGLTFASAVDTTVGEIPAKSMVIDFTEKSGCGAIFPMKQIYTVAVKDGKVYHLVLTTTKSSYEKRETELHGLFAAAQWAGAKSAIAKK
jgi:hypothetical protein